MKAIDVKDNTYVKIGKEVNDKDPKFKVRDHVRRSKFKNIFLIKKVKNTVPCAYVINELKGEETIRKF